MIVLYGFGPGFGLPEVSPFVTKTEVQLKMAGLSYVKKPGTREDSPKGQWPYIDDGDRRVGDSTFIRQHIERAHGIDLDSALDERQRAEAWTIERMVENQLYWTLVYVRWAVPENFAKGPSHFFDQLPDAIRDDVRSDARARVGEALRFVGTARHSLPEIVELGNRSLAALSMLLGWKLYLMGDRPSAIDATAFAVLAALMAPFFDGPVRQHALQYANLVTYVDRMMGQYYPDHAWPSFGMAA